MSKPKQLSITGATRKPNVLRTARAENRGETPFRDLLSLLCFSPRSPPDIQLKIFGDHLTISDIARLDTALHGRQLREAMLSIWRRRDEAVPVIVFDVDFAGMTSDCLQWLSLRGISFRQL